MNKVLKSIFHISVLFLIIISLWPGSLIGFLLYYDWGQQPNLIKNPFGTTINHFICYLFISLMGFYIYAKNEEFKKLVYGLFFFVNSTRNFPFNNTQSFISIARFVS